MTAINHQNNFSTNLTGNLIAGVTNTPLNSIPSVAAPFYLALDATNLNGKYEVILVTSKDATSVNHAATSNAHTTAEEVRMVIPAAEMDNLATISTQTGGAWVAYTPTPTNFVKGAGGTLEGFYTQIGKTVHARVHFKFGAGSSVSGSIIFNMPVTSISYEGLAQSQCLGKVTFLDSGTEIYHGSVVWGDTTNLIIKPYNAGSTYLIVVSTSSTVPFTWATDDEFWAEFTYQAA